MKHFTAVVALSALLSVAAFGVLVTADRRLGLSLPYSIPLSFIVVSIVAPALFALANAVRLRRPVIIKVKPVAPRPAQGVADASVAGRAAQGVVLLDFSNAQKLRERAA
jgi:hypothetical protein